jgi:hypothetical protein
MMQMQLFTNTGCYSPGLPRFQKLFLAHGVSCTPSVIHYLGACCRPYATNSSGLAHQHRSRSLLSFLPCSHTQTAHSLDPTRSARTQHCRASHPCPSPPPADYTVAAPPDRLRHTPPPHHPRCRHHLDTAVDTTRHR